MQTDWYKNNSCRIISKESEQDIKWFEANKDKLLIYADSDGDAVSTVLSFKEFIDRYGVLLKDANWYTLKYDPSSSYHWFVTYKQNTKPDSKEVNTMANVTESFKTVMSMKMLSSIMKDKDQDLGKLFLMQQMMNGEPLQVTDVIKSKLIKQFDLSEDADLPLEKVMLLQMLDGGQVDMNQLIMFKMMGSLFDDE